MPSLLPLVIALGLGLLLADAELSPCGPLVGALTLGLASLALAVRRPLRRPLFGLLAMCLALGLGVLRGSGAPTPRIGVAAKPPSTWEGTIVHGPWQRRSTGWWADIEVDAQAGPAGVVRLAGRDNPGDLRPGDRVRVRARIRQRRSPGNPGEPPRRPSTPRWQALAHTRGAVLRVGSGPSSAAAEAPRWRLANQLLAASGRRAGGTIAALALGVRGLLEQADREAFAATGTAHALAVSGLHLGLVGLWLHALFRFLLSRSPWLLRRIRLERWTAALTMAGLVGFTALTGAATPTRRALVLAAFVLMGRATGRRPASWNVLALAAGVILLASPSAPRDVSFQLSFAAVAGILWSQKGWAAMTAGREPHHAGVLRRAGAWLAGGAWVSVAAGLATLPVLAVHFHRVAPATVLTNLVVVPWLALAVLPGAILGTLAVAALPPGLHDGVLAAPTFVTEAWLDGVGGLAKLFPPIVVQTPSVFGVMLMVLAAAILLRAPALRRPARAAALGAFLLASAWSFPAEEPASAGWRATVLNVGDGLAVVLRLPDARTVLVDGGGGARGAAAPARLLRALRVQGVDAIDLAVLSHPHADHADGLVAVAAAMPVRELWTASGSLATLPVGRLAAAVRARGGVVREVDGTTPAQRFGQVTLAVLWPPGRGEGRPRNENDASVVVRLAGPSFRLLLPGDIESVAESALVADRAGPSALGTDILVAPHHGRATSNTAGFVRAVRPRIVVYTHGPATRPRVPSQAVSQRYRNVGARELDTERDGAIRLEASDVRLSACAEGRGRGGRCYGLGGWP